MKIKEFQDELKKKKIDFALFFSLDFSKLNSNLVYFSQYSDIGALVIARKKAFLIVPRMEYEKAKNSRIKKVYIWNKKRLFEAVLEKLRKNKIKTKNIGIDKRTITLENYSALKKVFRKSRIVNINEICSKLREVKTKEEIRIIRKCCKITDNILKKCLDNFKKFKKESEAAAFLENETNKQGYAMAFKPIVASGKNSSQPHYESKNIKLRKGFCVIDFGIRYKGYCSDITRTIYIGKPSLKEREIYYLLLNIQNAAIKKIKAGEKCSELYGFVKNNLKQYKKYFIHGLGHGFGIEIHERPNLKDKLKDKLKENSVFTIEPGIYFPKKFGIRIEDDVLLTKKVELLTKTKKDLLIIKLK